MKHKKTTSPTNMGSSTDWNESKFRVLFNTTRNNCSLSVLIFKCLLVQLLFVNVIKCEMIFEMKLIEYNNPTNRTYSDKNCGGDELIPADCKTGFLFCLVDLPFRNPQNCSLGDFTTPVLGGNKILFSEKSSSNDETTYSYKFSIDKLPSQGIGMMIEVRDYFVNDKWEPIDFYTSALADVPLSIKSSNSTYTVRKRFSSLFNFNSSLLVQSKLYCARNYFGSNCEVYCDESNDYYACDSDTGARICRDGFLGDDCQIPNICSTVPCLNGGTCDSYDGINYACRCLPEYEGFNCQTKPYKNIYEDPCYSMPCFNSGKCSVVDSQFKCDCLPGFHGTYCEADLRRCSSSPCAKNCECIEVPHNYSFECSCPAKKQEQTLSSSSYHTKLPVKTKSFISDGAVTSSHQRNKFVSSFASVPYYSMSSSRRSSTYSSFHTKPVQTATVGRETVMSSSTPVDRSTNITKKATLFYDSTSSTESVRGEARDGFFTTADLMGASTPSVKQMTNFENKRPCIDFNPCKHGTCLPSNETDEFSCECNIGYMGPFCDLMRHPCDFKPCENGICEIVGDLYYRCLCKPNYTGVNCHIEIKPCDENTCLNGGKCRSLTTQDESDIGCDCPINFTGTICENEMIDQNPCDSNPCQNNGICDTKIVDFRPKIECLCPEMFYGELCEMVRDLCNTRNCLNGATCHELNSTNSECLCAPGFSGSNCQDDIDECENLLTCPENSVCRNTAGSFECICAPGHSGPNCEKNQVSKNLVDFSSVDIVLTSETTSVPIPVTTTAEITHEPMFQLTLKKDALLCDLCLNNASCIIHEDTQQLECICAPGFGGTYCDTEIDVCQMSQPCLNNGKCVSDLKRTDGYRCECVFGYTGDSCEKKLHICDLKNPCLNEGKCGKMENSQNPLEYVCECPEGYKGVNCETEIDGCEDGPCLNGATCKRKSLGKFSCDCAAGFEGVKCEKDVDVCARDKPCANNGKCLEGVGNNYTCTCALGFAGKNCQIDINECETSPCLNNGKCEQTVPGSYKCTCEKNFVGKNCEKELVDKCKNYCLNNSTCILENEQPKCICNSAYFGAKCDKSINTICENKICLNGGTCKLSEVSKVPQCVCSKGYTGDSCETKKLCKKPEKTACYNNGSCLLDNDGQEFCECARGFIGDSCELSLRSNTNQSFENSSLVEETTGKVKLTNGSQVNGTLSKQTVTTTKITSVTIKPAKNRTTPLNSTAPTRVNSPTRKFKIKLRPNQSIYTTTSTSTDTTTTTITTTTTTTITTTTTTTTKVRLETFPTVTKVSRKTSNTSTSRKPTQSHQQSKSPSKYSKMEANQTMPVIETDELTTPTTTSRMSVLTLISLLALIYGLAIILAVVWIVWLYLRRKSARNLKNAMVVHGTNSNFNNDSNSPNSINHDFNSTNVIN